MSVATHDSVLTNEALKRLVAPFSTDGIDSLLTDAGKAGLLITTDRRIRFYTLLWRLAEAGVEFHKPEDAASTLGTILCTTPDDLRTFDGIVRRAWKVKEPKPSANKRVPIPALPRLDLSPFRTAGILIALIAVIGLVVWGLALMLGVPYDGVSVPEFRADFARMLLQAILPARCYPPRSSISRNGWSRRCQQPLLHGWPGHGGSRRRAFCRAKPEQPTQRNSSSARATCSSFARPTLAWPSTHCDARCARSRPGLMCYHRCAKPLRRPAGRSSSAPRIERASRSSCSSTAKAPAIISRSSVT
jgi:hypothetical protein